MQPSTPTKKLYGKESTVKSSKSEQNIIFKRKYFTFQNLKLSYLDTETRSEQVILITHANGYSAECYSYLIEAFRLNNRCVIKVNI